MGKGRKGRGEEGRGGAKEGTTLVLAYTPSDMKSWIKHWSEDGEI